MSEQPILKDRNIFDGTIVAMIDSILSSQKTGELGEAMVLFKDDYWNYTSQAMIFSIGCSDKIKSVISFINYNSVVF